MMPDVLRCAVRPAADHSRSQSPSQMSTLRAGGDRSQPGRRPAIRTLDFKAMEEEHELLPTTQAGRIERLVKLYSGVWPLLTAKAALPLMPAPGAPR
jgi:hypothetical protein